MSFPSVKNKRENEEILTKLDRILNFCQNTKETVETMIIKYNNINEIYNENKMKEEVKVVSSNLDGIMNFIDPIFKHYLIVPNSTENENAPNFLNTRKSDNLIKYENSLLENLNKTERNIIESNNNLTTGNLNDIEMNSTNSPNTINNVSNLSISENNLTKIKDNINTISKTLNDKLKKQMKDQNVRNPHLNPADTERRNLSEIGNILEISKKWLNKK